MKISEIRLLSEEEIIAKLTDARNELMNLRFQIVMGQQTDTSRLKATPPPDCPIRDDPFRKQAGSGRR